VGRALARDLAALRRTSSRHAYLPLLTRGRL
jgi:hypothetical protein